MHTSDSENGSSAECGVGAPAAERMAPTGGFGDVPSGPLPRRTATAARRSRMDALVSLLGDDDPRVVDTVRRRIEEAGREALPALRRSLRDDSSVTRGRARTILLDRAKTRAMRRLMSHVTNGRIDLETSLLLLARYHDPSLDTRPWRTKLDVMSREVRARAAAIEDPLEKCSVLSSYLGRELGYGGSNGDFHHPDNIHLTRVLDKKRGMPLTLSAIYVFVARRAGLHATCVPLPGHVMVRLHAQGRTRIVDPYHRGQVRTERDLKAYLTQNGLPARPSYFRDGDDATLLKRQIANLTKSAQTRGLVRERRELTLLARALESRTEAAASRRA